MRGLVTLIATGILLLAGPLLLACDARADAPCPIPDGLPAIAMTLPMAKQSVAAEHRLVILTLGGANTLGVAAGDRALSYPARLQAELTAALPGTTVSVANEAIQNNTTEAVLPTIPGLIAKAKAKLVIWAPGAHDAVRRSDPTGFFDSVTAGIEAVRRGGADLVLLDLQYVPSLEQWSRIEDYRDLLRGAASANDVPLVPRHELMRAWSEDGTLDLDAAGKAEQAAVARRLFSCMAQVLAVSIAEAVH